MKKIYFFLIPMFVLLLIPNVYADHHESEDLPEVETPPVAEEAPGRAENLPGEEVAPGEETPPGIEDVGRAGGDEELMDETQEMLTDDSQYISPKKQVMQGTVADAVKCNEGLELIFKTDGTPACVKSQTAKTLVERGWALDGQ